MNKIFSFNTLKLSNVIPDIFNYYLYFFFSFIFINFYIAKNINFFTKKISHFFHVKTNCFNIFMLIKMKFYMIPPYYSWFFFNLYITYFKKRLLIFISK